MAASAFFELGTKQDFCLRLRIEQQRLIFEGEPQGFVGYRLDNECDDGVFVRWHYQDGCFSLTTDRLGLFPLYYLKTKHELLLSNSVPLIRQQHELAVDTEAVSLFLRLGFYLGSDTAFKGLQRPEGQLNIRADPSGIQLDTVRPTPEAPAGSHTVACYQRLMEASLALVREERQPLYMPLTGGKDSRHIFLSLARQNIKPDLCYTVSVLAPHYNDDVAIGQKLAALLAVEHKVLAADQSLIPSECSKNLKTNFESRDHSWAAPAAQFFEQAPTGIVLDGFGGDVLSQSSVITAQMHQLYRQQDWRGLIRAFVKDNRYFDCWLNRQHQAFIASDVLLEQRLVQELSKYRSDINPMAQFFFWNRSRRSIAISSIRYLSGQSTAFMPFMQKNLVDFLFTLPVEQYFSNCFHSDTIQQLMPASRALAFSQQQVAGSQLNYRQWQRLLTAFLCYLGSNSLLSPARKLRASCLALSSVRDRSQLVRLLFSFRKIAYLQGVLMHADWKPGRDG